VSPRAIAAIAAALLAAACAPLRTAGPMEGDALQACRALYRSADAMVDGAGVRDGAAARIAGFPQLRVDRFLASFAEEAMQPEPLRAWVAHLAARDLEARRIEIANLPAADSARLLALTGEGSRSLERCASVLTESDLADPARVKALREAALVPDDYDTWKRVAGAYWLTRVPFAGGVRRYQAQAAQTFALPLERLEVQGHLVAYGTPRSDPSGAGAALAMDALGVPQPEAASLDRLFDLHAPVWIVDEVDADDRIGRLAFDAGGALHVDAAAPTVYRRLAYTRVGAHTLMQLVYSVWFPARPPSSAVDLLSGALDGLVWRVTLAPDGSVLMYDSIHSCGCYHQFFPTPLAELLPAASSLEEGAFVPQRIEDHGARRALRIAARTHYLQRVLAAGEAWSEMRLLAVEHDDALRSLARADGLRRSAFRSDGIVPQSVRGERFVFWPMGVRSPGAMRQWGRHATAFVGRRHFDEARLLERYFRFDLPASQ